MSRDFEVGQLVRCTEAHFQTDCPAGTVGVLVAHLASVPRDLWAVRFFDTSWYCRGNRQDVTEDGSYLMLTDQLEVVDEA